MKRRKEYNYLMQSHYRANYRQIIKHGMYKNRQFTCLDERKYPPACLWDKLRAPKKKTCKLKLGSSAFRRLGGSAVLPLENDQISRRWLAVCLEDFFLYQCGNNCRNFVI